MDCNEDCETCWICLEGVEGIENPPRPLHANRLIKPCRCPRVVHSVCLAKWQLSQSGRSEEKFCRFCRERLPEWQANLALPGMCSVEPVMSVHFNGLTHMVKVKPGEEGRLAFIQDVRRLLRLRDNQEFSITFECKVPGHGMFLDLKGLSSYDAAVFCAAMTAVERQRLAAQKAATRSAAAAASTAGSHSGRAASGGGGGMRQPCFSGPTHSSTGSPAAASNSSNSTTSNSNSSDGSSAVVAGSNPSASLSPADVTAATAATATSSSPWTSTPDGLPPAAASPRPRTAPGLSAATRWEPSLAGGPDPDAITSASRPRSSSADGFAEEPGRGPPAAWPGGAGLAAAAEAVGSPRTSSSGAAPPATVMPSRSALVSWPPRVPAEHHRLGSGGADGGSGGGGGSAVVAGLEGFALANGAGRSISGPPQHQRSSAMVSARCPPPPAAAATAAAATAAAATAAANVPSPGWDSTCEVEPAAAAVEGDAGAAAAAELSSAATGGAGYRHKAPARHGFRACAARLGGGGGGGGGTPTWIGRMLLCASFRGSRGNSRDIM